MTWGTFGITHIISLILGAAMIFGLYFLLKKLSEKQQIIILGALSFFGMGAITFNLLRWNSPLEYLPFHLCSLNALILPFAVFLKNKTLCNVLLLWSLGAIFALVVNHSQANFEIFSWTFFFYYFPHVFEFAIPLLIFKLGIVEKDYRCIKWTLLITLIAYTIIHFINLGINNYCIENNILDWAGEVIQVNYMYSIGPENPLLQIFYNIIPYSYWYLLLAVPIIAVYLVIVYLPQIVNAIKKRK